MIIEFHDIPAEIRSMGITMKKFAEMLGITRQGLYYRIKRKDPAIHLAVYGLAHYYEDEKKSA